MLLVEKFEERFQREYVLYFFLVQTAPLVIALAYSQNNITIYI
jgi:hypothetical protein